MAAIEKRYGFIPGLAGVFAESPGAFKGLLGAIQAFDDDALTLGAIERQVVQIAAAVENRCGYCVAAHSTLVATLGLDRVEIMRLHRQERLTDHRLEALREFTTTVVRDRGRVQEGALDGFLGAGYAQGQVLEVLLGVALKTLTNYASHIARPEINAQFSQYAPGWEDAA